MFADENIAKTDQLFPLQPIGADSEVVKPAAPGFASLMQQAGTGASSPLADSNKLSMVSPFELVQGKAPLAQAPTLATIQSQVVQAQTTLGEINTSLNYPNLKIKSGQKYVLNNKLSDAAMSLKAANAKMGADVHNAPNPTQFRGPLGKFLALIADGQAQLESAKNQLQNLKNKGAQLSPGDFLLIQVKMNKAQQELDFSSVLLSNAVQDFKMLMQVQL